jgi:hypothetical protein
MGTPGKLARRSPQQGERRQRLRLTCELHVRLLEMIQVQVAVAAGPDQIPDRQVRLLRQDVRQRRIGRDVEWHAEEDVRAALIDLAGEPAVGDVELEQCVARGERHPVEFAHVPGADDDAARIRFITELLDHPRNLVDPAAVRGLPGAPLAAIDRAQFPRCIGPFVPDRDALLPQRLHIRLAAQEPQQFHDHGLQVQPLGRDKRKAVAQLESQLPAEDRQRAGAGAVGLPQTVLPDVAHEIEKSLHQA